MPPVLDVSPLRAPDNRIANAFVAACGDELAALKPGNVHRYGDGHGMCVADFTASANAAAPGLTRRGSSVGQRIFEATSATRALVGCNTNLGIVLLCAPLACAAENILAQGETRIGAKRLAAAATDVLEQLDVDDAESTYRAIALANPGGLGEVQEGDVHAPARIGLRDAMTLAGARDRVALQYVTGFADIFDLALPMLVKLLAEGASLETATTRLFLALLAKWPDTHLLRKFGDSVAHTVTLEAARLNDNFMSVEISADMHEKLLAWDRRLKTQGLNPGTTADLTVATLFVHRLRAH
jgi:triphosphoribosyl-dephospho-CoA synthase